jgi:hypothetical protein
MPVKRRASKSRSIDDLQIQELQEGPGTCLLAGMGYYQPRFGPGAIPGESGGFFWELPADGQARILGRMRDDWERHRELVMAAWQGPGLPWAAREFGG